MEGPTFSILSCFLCMGVESNQWSQQAMHQSFNQLWSLSPIPFRFSIWPLITLLAIGLQQRVTTSWNKTTPELKVIELILKSLFHTDYTDIYRTSEYVILTGKTFCNSISNKIWLNRLTPNDSYMGRTAPLTSKRCILFIYSTNIVTEYFKHAVYSPFFFSSKCSLFHNAKLFGSCIIHILYTGCAKIKKNNSGAKGLTIPTVYKVHTPTNAANIKIGTVLKFTLKITSTCSYMFRSLSTTVIREPSLELT